MANFNAEYHNILAMLLHCPDELNERTGSKVKALPHQVISIPIERHIPVVGSRQVYPKSAAAELAWALMGAQDITWLQKHTVMWDKFTNARNEIDCAYGWRWQTAFGRNQLLDAINALKADPSDRQIVIQTWDPSKDGLGNRWSKNVPCPIGFMLNIINGKLNLSVQLRSSDIVVGLAYDSIFYALLLVAIANELNVGYGQYTIFLNHAHIYASHYGIAEQMLRNYVDYLNTGICKPDQFIPQDFLISGPIADWGISKIIQEPDEYVEYIKTLTTRPKSMLRAMSVNPEVIL